MADVVNVRRIMGKQHRKRCSPFMTKFVSECLVLDEKKCVCCDELFTDFETAVAMWTDEDSRRGQTQFLMGKRAFFLQFRSATRTLGIEPTFVGSKRGYRGVGLKRPVRVRRVTASTYNKIQEFIRTNPTPPVKIQTVKDERNAGKCVFASRPIIKGEVICEYVGELVSSDEAGQREQCYGLCDGKPPAMVVIRDRNTGNTKLPDLWIDAHVFQELPVAATINHSTVCPNLSPVVTDRASEHPRMFLVALHDIPETVELLWNYNDTTMDFYVDNLTLPL